MPKVNSDILRWSRKTAGLTLGEAAAKLRIGDVREASAEDRLRALEKGEAEPTRAVLSRMATQYRRPLLTFYLARPPRPSDRGRDFRASSANRSPRDEALLNALVRSVQARQGLLRAALLDDEDGVAPLAFPGSATIDTPVERVVQDIRSTLGLELSAFRAANGAAEAFRLLRSHAEEAGVFVLLLGNLGSYHTDLDTEVFRGFALADPQAPFVVVNPKDSAGGRSFTLLHELAHLWLNQSGISGGHSTGPVEVFCNRVASEFLLSDEELAALRTPARDLDGWEATIVELAGARNVSASMVAYRLYLAAAIDRPTWLELQNRFRDRWQTRRAQQRRQQAARDGGPSRNVLMRHYLGSALVDLTFRLEAAGSLSIVKAARVLGVHPRNAHALAGAI